MSYPDEVDESKRESFPCARCGIEVIWVTPRPRGETLCLRCRFFLDHEILDDSASADYDDYQPGSEIDRI